MKKKYLLKIFYGIVLCVGSVLFLGLIEFLFEVGRIFAEDFMTVYNNTTFGEFVNIITLILFVVGILTLFIYSPLIISWSWNKLFHDDSKDHEENNIQPN